MLLYVPIGPPVPRTMTCATFPVSIAQSPYNFVQERPVELEVCVRPCLTTWRTGRWCHFGQCLQTNPAMQTLNMPEHVLCFCNDFRQPCHASKFSFQTSVQLTTSPQMDKVLIYRKSSFRYWTGRPPRSHDYTGALRVGLESILAGWEDDYAHGVLYWAVGLFLCGSIGPPQVVHALYVCAATCYTFVPSGTAFSACVHIQVPYLLA